MSSYTDVTVENFEEVLEKIPALIDSCSFISLDGSNFSNLFYNQLAEFSGINAAPELKAFYFDDLETRYEKVKISARHFEVFQMGLSFFIQKTEGDIKRPTVVSHTFNFNIFKSHRRNGCVHVFENDSLRFLRDHHMDFNKIIDESIPYINRTELNSLRAIRLRSERIPITGLRPDDLQWLKEIRYNLEHWHENETETKTYNVYPQNTFYKRLVFENFETKWEDVYARSAKDEGRRDCVQFIRTETPVAELMEMDLMKKMGFSRVIQMMEKFPKPIIVHNGILDLAHIYNKFIDPLPNTVNEFRKALHAFFPVIIDTKYISCVHQAFKKLIDKRNTKLSDLSRTVGVWDEIEVISPETSKKDDAMEEDGEEEESDWNAHQAGYDSFLTGSIYAHMLGYLSIPMVVSSFSNIAAIVAYSNVVYMVNFSGDFHLEENSQPREEDRSNVFFITSIPSTWKTRSVLREFEDYGTPKVFWINKCCAFVQLRRKHGSGMLEIERCKREKVEIPDINREYICMTYFDALEKGILKTVVNCWVSEINEKKRKISEEIEGTNARKKGKWCTVM